MTARLHRVTPDSVEALWERFNAARRHFAFGFGLDAVAFVELLMADDTVVYELGQLGGVIYFTQVLTPEAAGTSQEPVARVHVCIWERTLLGRAELATSVGLHFMRATGVRRLFAEVPVFNRLAISYAQRAGMKVVGALHQRARVTGTNRYVDSIVLNALVSDLERAAAAGPPRRQRASVRLVAEGSHG